jgi:hypothetical protein
MGARLVNAVLGLWLFTSAFLWPHASAQRVNAWSVGIVAVTAALAGLGRTKAGRYVNAAAGAWLMISALFLPRLSPATFWNHMIVGFGLVLFAMASNLSMLRGRRADM